MDNTKIYICISRESEVPALGCTCSLLSIGYGVKVCVDHHLRQLHGDNIHISKPHAHQKKDNSIKSIPLKRLSFSWLCWFKNQAKDLYSQYTSYGEKAQQLERSTSP